MVVKLVYVYPIVGDSKYLDLALRFIKTYHDCPAGFPHDSIVVCNGGGPSDEVEFLFGGLENVRFMHHDNTGQDIGAFQLAARENPCDLMVFLGATAYLRGAGWLARMVEARHKHGDTLYGTTANRGAGHVQPHIRTTGFFISTALFNAYPNQIRTEDRYNFEHSQASITSWIKDRGLTPWLVYWDRELRERNWDDGPNGYHQNSQANVIVGDRLTCPPYHPVA